ncbi:SIMPL domain-containing protein [Asticcacaulis sp. BYS171W]|uniref:SIMPL domain-containing protein n=1 Tax=Asticcacaulis aquaticus TaxID=2984212 RepID=A0ABT5HW24_9CAUL|nr:SIMPL domain-containing protein [Asticcacaulis aquaticus]MDC7684270.1 SIMPL domain-containing protein [Asticcacaulis aquaticus]
MKKTLSLSAAILILGFAAAPVLAQPAPVAVEKMMPEGTILNLSETAEVKSAPDVAFITFGVVSEGKTAQEAMAANAAQMNSVFAAVKKQGIADKHVQTSGLNLNAVYDYPPNATPVLRGYQASNQISVRVEDLSKLGVTIDAVVKAGINQINGISFGLKDSSKAADQARMDATKTLRARADLYARSLGLTVKRIKVLSEAADTSGPRPVPMYKTMAMDRAESTPIAGGEVSTSLTLNAVFELE